MPIPSSNHLQWECGIGENPTFIAIPDGRWMFTITITNNSRRRVELIATRRSGDNDEVRTMFREYFTTLAAAAAYAADDYLDTIA